MQTEPPPIVAVGPLRSSFEVAMYHLQHYIVPIPNPENMVALRTLGSHVYSFASRTSTGRVVHWFLPCSRRVRQQTECLRAQGYMPIVFSSFGPEVNVQYFLETWLGRPAVREINDQRFLAISRALVEFDQDEGVAAAMALDASLQTYEQEQQRHLAERGQMPLEWRKRLRSEACQKAQPGQPACIVCRENAASVVFLDCRHVIACEECVRQNWERAPGSGAACCFECRTPWLLGPGSIYLAPAL